MILSNKSYHCVFSFTTCLVAQACSGMLVILINWKLKVLKYKVLLRPVNYSSLDLCRHNITNASTTNIDRLSPSTIKVLITMLTASWRNSWEIEITASFLAISPTRSRFLYRLIKEYILCVLLHHMKQLFDRNEDIYPASRCFTGLQHNGNTSHHYHIVVQIGLKTNST